MLHPLDSVFVKKAIEVAEEKLQPHKWLLSTTQFTSQKGFGYRLVSTTWRDIQVELTHDGFIVGDDVLNGCKELFRVPFEIRTEKWSDEG